MPALQRRTNVLTRTNLPPWRNRGVNAEPSYVFHQFDGYGMITLRAGLNGAQWTVVDRAVERLVERLTDTRTNALLLDLRDMDGMGSAMVALVLRVWKTIESHGGRMVVLTTQPEIHRVLAISGLTNLWPIVETMEDGIHELGWSPEAIAVERESQLLDRVTPLSTCMVVIGLCLYLLVSAGPQTGYRSHLLIATGVCGCLALSGGVLSALRPRGLSMVLSCLIALGGLVVIGSAVWKW